LGGLLQRRSNGFVAGGRKHRHQIRIDPQRESGVHSQQTKLRTREGDVGLVGIAL